MSMASHGFCHIPFELHSWDKGGRVKEGSRIGRVRKRGDVASSDPNIRVKSPDQYTVLWCAQSTKEVYEV